MVGNMVESGKFASAKLCGHGFTNLEDSTAAEELVEGRAMTMLEALLAGIALENGHAGEHFTAGITLGCARPPPLSDARCACLGRY